MDGFLNRDFSIKVGGELMQFDVPKIMGILNITPDSFFDGGKYNSEQLILQRVKEMLHEGADIIDIGACSTRPGADLLNDEIEWQRLAPVLKLIREEYPEIVLSVDTFRSSIAQKSVGEYNVQIINDISSGNLDSKMFSAMVELQVPYVLMHIQNQPKNMQANPQYNDIVKDVIKDLSAKVNQLEQMGLNDIIIDPGFGFGKTVEHNYTLFSALREFKIFERPLLVGISRKSMIYKVLETNPEESLNGTTILNTLAIERGANILRVHDVKQAKECIKLVAQLKE